MIRLCAQVAPKLGFDITADEIRAGIAEMERQRREKASAGMETLPDEEVESATGGILWTGEDAPDGHELGCYMAYHGYTYQKDNDIWRSKEYCCDGRYWVPGFCEGDWR